MRTPRFLVDENLSIELPALAHAAGLECQHVTRVGLGGRGDPILMRRVIEESWTLVTNNAQEFLARYRARAALHEGLVLLLAANGLDEQKAAFRLALAAVQQGTDLMKSALFIERAGENLQARLVPWPRT